MDHLRIWASLLLVVVFLSIHKWRQTRAGAKTLQPVVGNSAEWEYPEPSPDASFDLEKTESPKFRAFRYKYTRHTIEVAPCDKDSWVKLDNDWPRYHQMKVHRLADRGSKVVQTMDIARAAAHELCQDLCEFLVGRYPQVYKVNRSSKDALGWGGKGSITNIAMPPLNVSYDLTKEDPLTVAGLIQPADLNVLLKDEDDNSYHLVAMMLGIGGGQRIKDKLGKSLADLHFEGQVPHYAEQLQNPLDRFLSKLTVQRPIQRNTTGITIHDDYHWPAATMGDEDDWDSKIRGPGVGTPSHSTFTPPGPIQDVSQLWFRQERQVLRRLPKSGAIVWMVHTYVERLTDVAQEAGVPGRMASLVRSWDDTLAEHKGRHLYEHVLLPYLDDLHAKQVESGVCADGELPSKFPF